MVFINHSSQQMSVKVVYYGPGLCGKTTNLQWIFDNTAPNTRGEMVALATETDRTLFFDLLPIDAGTVGNFETRIQLYTVPGQVFYNSTRKLVLKGVDGIVFVADSQRTMAQANVESLDNLAENLREMGRTLDEVPLILQFNKRDLPELLSVEELNRSLNRHGWKWIEASALNGEGVLETLVTISKTTLRALRARLANGRLEELSPDGAAAAPPSPPAAAPPPAEATPPAAAAEVPRIVTLRPDIMMRERVSLGKPCLLRIEVPPPASGSVSFDALVTAPDFEISDSVHQTLQLPRDTDPLLFKLVPLSEGRKRIKVELFRDARFVGGAALETEVTAEDAADAPPVSAPGVVLIDREAPAADLTILVTERRLSESSRSYRFTLHSPDNGLDFHTVEEEQRFYGSPTSWIEGLYGELATLQLQADAEDLAATLSTIGTGLYEQLFPRRLRRLWHERLRGQVRTIAIVSDELWIPWEWIRPFSTDGEGSPVGDDFLCADYAIGRWTAGPPAPAEIGVTGAPRDFFRNDLPLVYVDEPGSAGNYLASRKSGFLGCTWKVRNDLASRFATALYKGLREGHRLGEAMRAARAELRGLPTSSWLAYQLFGDPACAVRFPA